MAKGEAVVGVVFVPFAERNCRDLTKESSVSSKKKKVERPGPQKAKRFLADVSKLITSQMEFTTE